MLVGLSIRNVLFIDCLTLEFQSGFSALTGETGAGKSILLDSLSLALGMRGEVGLISQHSDQAVVTAEFNLQGLCAQHPLWGLLQEQAFDRDCDLLILRRVLHRTERTKAFINDQSVTIKTLKEVGALLLEIHSQFDNLFDTSLHQEILDRFAEQNHFSIISALSKVKQDYQHWKLAQQTLENYKNTYEQGLQQQSFHNQIIQDLANLRLLPNEEDSLLHQRQKLARYGKISSAVKDALQELYQSDLLAHVVNIQKSLERVNNTDSPEFKDLCQSFDRIGIEIQDALESLKKIHNQDQDSVEALENLDERLHTLRSFARRYHITVNELHDFYKKSLDLLDQQAQATDHLTTYHKKVDQSWEDYQKSSDALTQMRQQAADHLCQAVSAELPDLKLAQAQFVVSLEPGNPSSSGSDNIEFLISANPGQPPESLNKAASGGELSRLMLALKVVLARCGFLKTIVFDEVDTGVGGAVAAAIGQRLKKLSQEVQILAITHLPQVAAFADQHYCVTKNITEKTSKTEIQKLNTTQREDELARMLAGAVITLQARAAAKQLLIASQKSGQA